MSERKWATEAHAVLKAAISQAYLAGQRDMRERAAKECEAPNAGLVSPDGGDPTPREMLANVAAAIRALPDRDDAVDAPADEVT